MMKIRLGIGPLHILVIVLNDKPRSIDFCSAANLATTYVCSNLILTHPMALFNPVSRRDAR